MIKAMLLAGLGGFVGSSLRYLTGRMCQLLVVATFPLGTFVVNILGSLIIGILFGLAERSNMISSSMSVLLITGFCGGFTTFSSLANDIYLLLQQRHWLIFGTYTLLSLVLGVAMVWLGRWLVRA